MESLMLEKSSKIKSGSSPSPLCALTTSLNATSPRFWNTSRDSDSPTSLGSLSLTLILTHHSFREEISPSTQPEFPLVEVITSHPMFWAVPSASPASSPVPCPCSLHVATGHQPRPLMNPPCPHRCPHPSPLNPFRSRTREATWSCLCPCGYCSAGSLSAWRSAASQTAVRSRSTAAADDLKLLLSPVCPIQQLLNEVLQAHLGVGLAGGRLLQELVNLQHLPVREGQRVTLIPTQCVFFHSTPLHFHHVTGQGCPCALNLAWSGANLGIQGSRRCSCMQDECDRLILEDPASPMPLLGCTAQPKPPLPGLGPGMRWSRGRRMVTV